jgi:hypothetical protein
VLASHIVPFCHGHLVTGEVALIVVADGGVRESLVYQLRHQEFYIALQAPRPWEVRLSILIYYATYGVLQSGSIMFMINLLLNIINNLALLLFLLVHDVQHLLELLQLRTLLFTNPSNSKIDFLLQVVILSEFRIFLLQLISIGRIDQLRRLFLKQFTIFNL